MIGSSIRPARCPFLGDPNLIEGNLSADYNGPYRVPSSQRLVASTQDNTVGSQLAGGMIRIHPRRQQAPASYRPARRLRYRRRQQRAAVNSRGPLQPSTANSLSIGAPATSMWPTAKPHKQTSRNLVLTRRSFPAAGVGSGQVHRPLPWHRQDGQGAGLRLHRYANQSRVRQMCNFRKHPITRGSPSLYGRRPDSSKGRRDCALAFPASRAELLYVVTHNHLNRYRQRQTGNIVSSLGGFGTCLGYSSGARGGVFAEQSLRRRNRGRRNSQGSSRLAVACSC